MKEEIIDKASVIDKNSSFIKKEESENDMLKRRVKKEILDRHVKKECSDDNRYPKHRY